MISRFSHVLFFLISDKSFRTFAKLLVYQQYFIEVFSDLYYNRHKRGNYYEKKQIFPQSAI